MKVAIYARYSTNLQDKTSITGQVANCEALAKENDWCVIEQYSDEAISGTDDSRPGYQQLLADSENGKFDTIIVDETSRLTRRPGELPRLLEILAFRNQFLMDCKGFDSRQETAALLASIYGGIDSLELRKIKERTHRGLRERHKAGYSAGGRTYGYTSEAVDTSDPNTKWRKVINEDDAERVVWIFERYAEGMGGKRIAAELNHLQVPSPGASWKRVQRRKDGMWQHSAILGMAKRGSGILRNEIYIGNVIWNRSEWVKRPGTSIRTYRLRPRDQWIIEKHPELRIVPQELWDRVQARLSHTHPGLPKRGRRGTYLLTGILKCHHCGGSLTMIDKRCYGCGTRNRGGDAACDNAFRIRRDKLEDSFLSGVREQLLSPDTIRWAEKEISKMIVAPGQDTGSMRTEINATEADIARVVEAITKVGISDALERKLKDLEQRQCGLRCDLASAEKIVELPDISVIADHWTATVERLGDLPKTLTPGELDTVRGCLKALFGEVRVDRHGKGYAALGMPTNMVAGARLFLYSQQPPPTLVALI